MTAEDRREESRRDQYVRADVGRAPGWPARLERSFASWLFGTLFALLFGLLAVFGLALAGLAFVPVLLLFAVAMLPTLKILRDVPLRALRAWRRRSGTGADAFLCEISLDPPVMGERALRHDDPHDLGLLFLEPDAVRFEGAGAALRLRFDNIARVLSGRKWQYGNGPFGKTFCLQLKMPVDGYYRVSLYPLGGVTVFGAVRNSRRIERALSGAGKGQGGE